MGGLSKVIVLDPDARAGRQVELGFAREGVPATAVELNGGRPEIPADGTGLVIVGGAEAAALDLLRKTRMVLDERKLDIPVVFAGRGVRRTDAEAAGADEVVLLPAFLRDVVTIGRLLRGRPAGEREHLIGSLAETTGVFTLVRALAALGRSAVLTLIRGLRRGEIRFFHGEVTSAQVGLIHGQAAFHQLLLWTEARFEFQHEDIVRRHQIPLSPDELFADAERFLEGVRDESGKLSPSMVLEQDMARIGALGRQIPTEVHGVLRMFDGHRVLADILEDSPYRVFETLRVTQRACDVGLLRIVTSQRPKATWRAVLSIEEWLVGSTPADRDAAIERAALATADTGPAPKVKPRKGGKRKKRRSTGPEQAPSSSGSKPDIDWGALVPRVVGAEVGGLSGVVPAAQRSGEISLPPSRSVEREKLEALMDTQQRERVFAKDIGIEPSVVLDDAVDAAKLETRRAADAAKVAEANVAAEATAVAEAKAAVEQAVAANAATMIPSVIVEKRERKSTPSIPSIIVDDKLRESKPNLAPKLVEAAAATRIPKPTPAPMPLPGMPPPKTNIEKVIADKAAAEQAKADAVVDSAAERAAADARAGEDAVAAEQAAADKLAAENAVAEAKAVEETRVAREAAEKKADDEDARLRAEAADWAKQQAAARARAAEDEAREAEALAKRVADAKAKAEADVAAADEAMWKAAKQRAEAAEAADAARADVERADAARSDAARAVAATVSATVLSPGVVVAESPSASVVVHDHMTIDTTANTARVTSQSLAAITSGAPEELDDQPSDGIVRQFTTVETAPVRPPPPPPSLPDDDRPEDATGEIASRPRRPSQQQPPVATEPSILVADLAAAQAAIAAVAPQQAAAPVTPNAAPSVTFSDDEEEFFRAGQGNTGKVPQFAAETFDDLDEDYQPQGFWDRLRGKKAPPPPKK